MNQAVAAINSRKTTRRGEPRLRRSALQQSPIWILVALPVLVIPFENKYELFGFSLAKLTILPLLIGVLLLESKRFLTILKHPVFVCGASLLAWAIACEYLHHPSSDWEFVSRVAQTLVYAALVAAASKDLGGLRRVLMTVIVVCAALAIYLIYNFYGGQNAEGMDFQTASLMRTQVLWGMGRDFNLNILGYTVGMGAIVALTTVLTKEGWSRIVWAGIYVLCVVGAAIPASRGAFIGVLAGSGLIVWRVLARSTKSARHVLIVIVVLASLYAFTPEMLTARLSSLMPSKRTEVDAGKPEARLTLYTAAIEALPEYWALGIGAGNFWQNWGRNNGFSHVIGGQVATVGPHNGFFAVWIFFGLPGLSLLCLTCLMAGRRAPPRDDRSWDALSVTGLLVFGLFWLFFTHDLYLKQFGLILGLVIARDVACLQRRVNVGKKITGYIRHQATGSRRIGKATMPGAATTVPQQNRTAGSNA